MNAQLKQKWVEALRSGEYEQVRDSIGSAHLKQLCCIGVGACVANPTLEPLVTSDAVEALEEFGLVGYTDDNREYSTIIATLIRLNDREHKSFAEIADYIEANIPAEA